MKLWCLKFYCYYNFDLSVIWKFIMLCKGGLILKIIVEKVFYNLFIYILIKLNVKIKVNFISSGNRFEVCDLFWYWGVIIRVIIIRNIVISIDYIVVCNFCEILSEIFWFFFVFILLFFFIFSFISIFKIMEILRRVSLNKK